MKWPESIYGYFWLSPCSSRLTQNQLYTSAHPKFGTLEISVLDFERYSQVIDSDKIQTVCFQDLLVRWLLVNHVLRSTTKTSCVVVYTYTVSFIYGCINQHACSISLLLRSYFPERGWLVFEHLLTNMSVVQVPSSISDKARLGFAAGLIVHSPGTFQRVKPSSWQFAKILSIKIYS